MSRRLLVLCWHNIEPTWAFPGRSPEEGRRAFERQVRLLRRWTNVVPLRSALADLTEGRPLPSRAVALTFDDGYLDNVTVAAPVLASAGLPATFFLVPGFLSGTRRAWWEELGWAFAHATASPLTWGDERFDTSSSPVRQAAMGRVADSLKTLDSREREEAVAELSRRLAPKGPPADRRTFMDWDEAGQLLRYGHDIGSHTCGHPILSRETSTTQAHELKAARQELQSRFPRPVDVVAFPNGRAQDYSEITVRLAREAGYAFAVTTRSAWCGAGTPPLEMPRIVIDAETDLPAVLRKGLRVVKRRLPRVGRGAEQVQGSSPE
jgi:peptidoglycan/xylan/chitin deacetylase (PgdA/CDA1 family)